MSALWLLGALGPIGLVILIAQAGPVDGAPQWLEHGVLGLVILGAITGYIRFKPEVDGLTADKARLQAQVEELMKIQREQLPTLSSSAQALTGTARTADQVSDLAASVRQIDGLLRQVLHREE